MFRCFFVRDRRRRLGLFVNENVADVSFGNSRFEGLREKGRVIVDIVPVSRNWEIVVWTLGEIRDGFECSMRMSLVDRLNLCWFTDERFVFSCFRVREVVRVHYLWVVCSKRTLIFETTVG